MLENFINRVWEKSPDRGSLNQGRARDEWGPTDWQYVKKALTKAGQNGKRKRRLAPGIGNLLLLLRCGAGKKVTKEEAGRKERTCAN